MFSTQIPSDWQTLLAEELAQPYLHTLQQFLETERSTQDILPPEPDIFSAFALTPYAQTRVLLLGQDPYHGPGQAHGLCFSVRPGIKPPPSLVNLYKELESDLGIPRPTHGYLVPWAQQGILMLNTVLTVRAGQANSHKNQGWEQFTDAVIALVNAKTDPVIFVLWGSHAQKKAKLIDSDRHPILRAAHPSPLSAHNGFWGSKPFSSINRILEEQGTPPINWNLSAG
jgi:uracil-DNA glycosylase